jgi:restriction system protein
MLTAQRDAQRRAATNTREQERLLHEAGLAEAARLTGEVEQRVAALRTLLTASLAETPRLSFVGMRRQVRVAEFAPGPLAVPIPAPEWERFAPLGPPTGLAARFGGKTRYEQQLAAARQTYAQAVADHQRAEAERQHRLGVAHTAYTQKASAARQQAASHNQGVDAFEAAFRAGDPEAVEDYFGQLLAQSVYPPGFPDERRIAYRPEPRELWVEAELPDRAVVPGERGFKYVRTRKQIDALPRAERETKQLYASVVAQTALRMLRECFAADARNLVDVVVFNGHVSTRDPATGKQIHPCLVSVSANRETFDELELAHLDPVACLKHLNALVSPHPYDLVAVPPVVDFDLAKFKFIDEFDAAAELDGRFDLLEMDPFKFEHLVRQLFEKIGMKSWVTQASRDDGIDGVAIHEDPILGGVCVIQAKRYKGVVEADAVRALWGAMEDKRATKGILVTTSWFGSAGRQFAANHQERLRLIEGAELKHLLAEHLGLDVRIGLNRKPPRRRS